MRACDVLPGELESKVTATAGRLGASRAEVLAAGFLALMSRGGARAPESFRIRSGTDEGYREFGPVPAVTAFSALVRAVGEQGMLGPDLRCSAASGPGPRTDDLTLTAEPFRGGLRIRWEGLSPDGPDGGGRALADRYLHLLGEAAAAPDTRIGELPVLPPDQLELLERWSGTPDRFPGGTLVHELFERRARTAPDALAVQRQGDLLTYGELNARANRLARALRERGAAPERTVALLMERSVEMLVAFLAVFKSGAAAVLLDPGHPRARVERTIATARPRVLLTLDRLGPPPDCGTTCVLAVDREPAEVAALPDGDLGVRLHPDAVAYVVHTSGSTGEPKRVAVLHRSVAHSVRTHREGHRITEQDRAAWLAPPGASVSVGELWPYLASGASVHPAEPDVVASPRALRDWILAERVTTAYVSMPLAEDLYTLPWPGRASLRLLTVGSDKVRRWADRGLPFEVAVSYGSSEANGVSSCLVPWEDRLTSATAGPGDRDGPPPVGRPWPGARLRLLDARMRPVPPGAVGELYVGGPELARGYLGAPGLTAERFVPDPCGPPGSRLYRSGDLACFDAQGRLHHRGRVDHEVKVRGFRVHPGEVEAVLLECPGVRSAVVVPVSHPSGGLRLAAHLVADGTGTDQVRVHAEDRLPSHLLPSAYNLLDALPTTVNGKVDRAALPEVSWEADAYEAPRDALERELVGIFSKVLDVERVGISDDFFHLGGDSLAATRLTELISTGLGHRVSLRALRRHRTPADLADLLRAEGAATVGAL